MKGSKNNKKKKRGPGFLESECGHLALLSKEIKKNLIEKVKFTQRNREN